jgi:hypothetical protein
MATISSATNKVPDGTEHVPVSGATKYKVLISAIKDYVVSFFTNKATLDLLTVSDSVLYYNSIEVARGYRRKVYSGKTSSFTVAFLEDTFLTRVVFIENYGTPQVKLGSTSGGEEFLEQQVVNTQLTVNINEFNYSSYTLYVDITTSSGSVDVIVEYIKSYTS